MLELIFVFSIFLAVIGVFSFVVIRGRRKGAEESGRVPAFQEQAGGRFDGFNLTIPFVRHAVYEDFVVIAYGNRRHVLKFSDIKCVSNKWHLFSKGLIYQHSRADVPSQCIVWSFRGGKILEYLESKGVPICENA
ncbi:MAG: hypothetical protein R3270_07300 [Gammaproteobacteria bacterium]|nr:hypothetical protein [Gammaproteobacteria bacterium]